jgi:GTP-binding protein HflX
MEVVEKVLRDLQAEEIPQLVVFNKADLIRPGTYLPRIENSIVISALRDEDLQRLLKQVEEYVLASYNQMTLKVPVERGDILSLLHREGVEMEQEFVEAEAAYLVKVRVNRDNPVYGRIHPFLLNKPEIAEESW